MTNNFCAEINAKIVNQTVLKLICYPNTNFMWCRIMCSDSDVYIKMYADAERIHLGEQSDSSSSDGHSDFDDDYEYYKPDPIRIPLDKLIIISPDKLPINNPIEGIQERVETKKRIRKKGWKIVQDVVPITISRFELLKIDSDDEDVSIVDEDVSIVDEDVSIVDEDVSIVHEDVSIINKDIKDLNIEANTTKQLETTKQQNTAKQKLPLNKTVNQRPPKKQDGQQLLNNFQKTYTDQSSSCFDLFKTDNEDELKSFDNPSEESQEQVFETVKFSKKTRRKIVQDAVQLVINPFDLLKLDSDDEDVSNVDGKTKGATQSKTTKQPAIVKQKVPLKKTVNHKQPKKQPRKPLLNNLQITGTDHSSSRFDLLKTDNEDEFKSLDNPSEEFQEQVFETVKFSKKTRRKIVQDAVQLAMNPFDLLKIDSDVEDVSIVGGKTKGTTQSKTTKQPTTVKQKVPLKKTVTHKQPKKQQRKQLLNNLQKTGTDQSSNRFDLLKTDYEDEIISMDNPSEESQEQLFETVKFSKKIRRKIMKDAMQLAMNPFDLLKVDSEDKDVDKVTKDLNNKTNTSKQKLPLKKTINQPPKKYLETTTNKSSNRLYLHIKGSKSNRATQRRQQHKLYNRNMRTNKRESLNKSLGSNITNFVCYVYDVRNKSILPSLLMGEMPPHSSEFLRKPIVSEEIYRLRNEKNPMDEQKELSEILFDTSWDIQQNLLNKLLGNIICTPWDVLANEFLIHVEIYCCII